MIQMPLSDQIVERLQHVATKRHTDVKELLERAVELYLLHAEEDDFDEELDAWEQAQRQIIEREMAAYTRQHKELLERYRGQSIAMHEGKVVDHDVDQVALSRRVRARFGKQPILITPVLSRPKQEIFIRSPQIEW